MKNAKSLRLSALIVLCSMLAGFASNNLPAETLAAGLLWIASTIGAGVVFLFTKLDFFEKIGDTAGLTAAEIRSVNFVSRSRQGEIMIWLGVGLLGAFAGYFPWLAGKLGIAFEVTPSFTIALGVIVGIACNCVFVYFDWRTDVVRLQQTAKERAAQRAEADKALSGLRSGEPLSIGTLDGFRST